MHVRLDAVLDTPGSQKKMPEMYAAHKTWVVTKKFFQKVSGIMHCYEFWKQLDSLLSSPARGSVWLAKAPCRMGCTDDIAETYFALAQQSPLGWSNEIDIRPFQEWEMEVGVQQLQELNLKLQELNFLPNFCKTKKEPLPP